VVTAELQRASAGHVVSPPPLAVAVLVTLAAAAGVGVIGMMKLVLADTARPRAIVQVTVWPAAVQPAGNVPIVRPAGIVSVIVLTAVVAAVPVFWTLSVYEAGVPTVNAAALAVLVIVSCGALTGVGPTVEVQRAATGQVGSPPPETVAVFVTLAPAARVGVTGMMKLVVAMTAKPGAIVQVTTWAAAVQPAGSVPIVKPAGMVSVIVLTAVVAAVPVFWTLSVYEAGVPTVKDAALAVLVIVNCGRFTGVVTAELQRASTGHVVSPPPETVAVFVTLAADAVVGVTGMMKLVVAPTAKLAMVQVTVWPAAVQPAGSVPIVRPAGMVSVIVLTAVVGAVPAFCTLSV